MGLLDQIVTAATHRLVLITPQPGGGDGYDVRSLQEMMAALALTTGTVEEAVPTLRKIGASPQDNASALSGRWRPSVRGRRSSSTVDMRDVRDVPDPRPEVHPNADW